MDINGTDDPDTLNGGAGDDDIDGLLGSDVLRGFNGNDRIQGGGGNDRLEGGNGNDSLVDDYNGSQSEPDNDTMDGGAGDDQLISYQAAHFQDIDLMRGGEGNDTIALYGGQTGDSVDGGDGIDMFGGDFGSGATIVLAFSNSSFVVQVNGTNTAAVANCEQLNFVTGYGNDSVVGSGLHDDILSLGGSDTLIGGAGDDEVGMITSSALANVHLNGGSGDDTLLLYTPNGMDYVINVLAKKYTQDGAKFGTLASFEALDVNAGDGNDTLIGGAFVDTIRGNEGDDSIGGGADNDTLTGGGGGDTISGGGGDDEIGMGDGKNKVDAGAGNDMIYGTYNSFTPGAPQDTIFAGDGNDTVSALAGEESVDGGTGTDTLELPGNDYTWDLSYVDGKTVITNFYTTITFSNIEFFQFDNVKLSASQMGVPKLVPGATNGNDLLNGTKNADLMRGLDGNDIMNGNQHNDVLEGGNGADSLNGGAGDDSISGGAGRDTIYGGEGEDQLTGGRDNDRFQFKAIGDSYQFAFFGADVITDFVKGNDRIDLATIDANDSIAGNQAFKFIGDTAFSALGQLRTYQSGGDTVVEINTTGTTSADMAILIKGLVSLKAVDFDL